MINIQIDEKPFIEAGENLIEVGCKVASKVKDSAEKVSDFLNIDATDVAYYSSVFGALATYESGDLLFSPLSLALNGTAWFSGRHVSNNKENYTDKQIESFDKARGIFSMNVLTQVFGIPGSIKLGLLAYNLLADKVTVSRN